jgi:AAA family ATP:ADP antiporter
MVFNFFVVSLFWSFMADVWNEEQGRRLFGFIAAGGSVGGIIGPKLAKHLAQPIGNSGLLIIATVLFAGALICLAALARQRHSAAIATQSAHSITSQAGEAFGGSSLQSLKLVLRSPFLLGIAALVCITSVVAQFAYIETGRLAKQIYTTQADVTMFYADIDYWTNIVALTFQAIVVGLLTSRFGIKAPLLGLPIIGGLSFVALAVAPAIGVLAVTNVIRRASEYGLGKPGRDMLYTVTTPREKYLAKNVIDTLIYRSSDTLGNWLHSALIALGLSLVGLSWTAAGILVGSAFIAFATVRGYHNRGGK